MPVPNDVLQRWQRRQGSHGRPASNYVRNPAVEAASRSRAGRTNAARAARSGGRRRRSLGGAAGAASSPSRAQNAYNYAYDKLVSEYVEANQKQNIINRVTENQAASEEEAIQNATGIAGAIGRSPLGGVIRAVGNSPVASWLDVISRPAYGTFEGMQTLAEQDKQEMEDKGFWEQGGEIANDFFGGFWRGFTGEDKTGFGQVYEAVKENPTTGVGEALRNFEEAHPTLEQGVAVGTGMFGEFFADPANLMLPMPAQVMRNTGRFLPTAATRDVLEASYQNASRAAVDDLIQNSPILRNNPYYLGRPDAFEGRVTTDFNDAFINANIEVLGGGAPHTRTLNSGAFPSTAAQKWQEAVTNALSGGSERHVINVWNNAKGGLTPQYINTARRSNPDFRRFWDDLTNDLVARGVSPGSSVDEILAVLKGGKVGKNTFFKHWENIKQGYHVELKPYTQKLFEEIQNPVRRTLGYRIGGKVVEVPVVGKAFGYAGSKLSRRATNAGLGKVFYETANPGIFANKISRARAYGIKGLDNMVEEIRRVARGLDPTSGNQLHKAFSPEEGRELFNALENGLTTLGDARKDWALTWLRGRLDEIFKNEAKEGARSIDDIKGTIKSVMQPDYVHIHAKGGTKAAREEFFRLRQESYDRHNVHGGYDSAKAKQMGLKPVDDAFQMLMLRQMKSSNDISKSFLWQDVIDNYAIMGNKPVIMKKMDANDRSLHAVEYSKLSQAYKQMMKDTNGKFYIPNQIHDLLKEAEKMLNWSTSDWNKLGRDFAKVMSGFKVALTIPYPGFHTRNFIGDTMMGMLDGVRPSKYMEILRKYVLNRAGKAPTIKIIDGLEYSFDDFMRLYREEANSGFINTELGTTNSVTAGPMKLGRKVGQTAVSLSDKRELLPRLTHYLHAYREEAQALAKKGVSLDQIERRARDAALWRVNHFKFDYNALMPWEKNLKTLVFPFYTYMRKAMPVLLEQMYINPHYFATINRFQQYNDGSAADAFNSMNIPDWVRDLGFATLTDEENPLVITGDILPTNSLDIINSRSVPEAAGDLISNLNPIAQMPFELAFKKTMFDQRPIEGGTGDYLLSKLPLVGDIHAQTANMPGIPGSTEETSILDTLTGKGDWTQLLRNRLLGGIPVRRISQGQQEQQMETNWDRLVEDPITEFNYSQGRWSINMNDSGVFQIFDRFSGQPLGARFSTPDEALDFARRLPKFNTNQASSLRPPTGQDLVEMLSQQR